MRHLISAAPASPTREYIYSGGQLLATIEAGATKYHMRDHLSVRWTTDANGTVLGQQGHYPYGESWYSTSTTTKWQFTSYMRHTESGNDYAIARYHVNRLARFNAPDPIAGSPADPQSLNRYAYVANDPVNLTDPLGLRPPAYMEYGGEGGACFFGFCGSGSGVAYYIDGIRVSSALGEHFLERGTAAACPNNDCRGVTYQGDTVTRVTDRSSGRVPVYGYVARNTTVCNDGTCGPGIRTDWEVVGWALVTVTHEETYYYEAFLYHAGNFFAGAGDCLTGRCIPFVNTSLTEKIRQRNGDDSVVNKSGGAYTAGRVTGEVVGTSLVAAAVPTVAALADGKYGTWFGRGGEAFFNRGPVRFGWYWNGVRDAIGLRIGPARTGLHIPFWFP